MAEIEDMDIFFIDKELLPFSELLLKAKKKHVGLDDYWLAVAMMKIKELRPLPRMVKPLSEDEMITFFFLPLKC